MPSGGGPHRAPLQRPRRPRDDLKQVPRMGLVKAVARFDSTRESEFLSFAVPTMMGEVRGYFRDSGSAVRVPRRLQELYAQVNSVTADRSHRMGRAPTASELATALGVHRQDVVEALIAEARPPPRRPGGPRLSAAVDPCASRSRTNHTGTSKLRGEDTITDRRTAGDVTNARFATARSHPGVVAR